MRFVFDIIHPAHINFYKHLIYQLRDEGHNIDLVCLNRGRTLHIMQEEFPGFSITPIGKYARSRLGLYMRTGLLRMMQLARFYSDVKPDASLTVAAFQTDFLSWLFRFKSLGAYDDSGHINLRLSKRFVDRFLLPECLAISGPNIVSFRGLKEWAYLSPAYLQPNEEALAPYGVSPKEYVFVRDVDTASLNYRAQVVNNIELLYKQGLSEVRVILSLENKKLSGNYPKWQILEEPVREIHSLMYYSRLVISSGDSMAREGAELGVPSVYCGQRVMPANQVLIDLGFLHHITEPETIISQLRDGVFDLSEDQQIARRNRLLEEWDDPNEIAYQNLMALFQD